MTRGPKRIGDVLPELMARRGYARVESTALYHRAWNQAAGPLTARYTRLGSLRRGTLEVIVANSTLIQELGLEFPSGATMDFQVMPTYEITAIPTTLFMKPNGLVRRRENTLLSREILSERIEDLIEASAS